MKDVQNHVNTHGDEMKSHKGLDNHYHIHFIPTRANASGLSLKVKEVKSRDTIMKDFKDAKHAEEYHKWNNLNSFNEETLNEDVNEKEATHYHSVWYKHDNLWKHHGDFDTASDANDEKRSMKMNGEKAKSIRVHKDEADWRKPEHVAKARKMLSEDTLNETRFFVHKVYPDIHQHFRVAKQEGYKDKVDAQVRADMFNKMKDKHEIPHHFAVVPVGSV